jgi:hypothetical protein
VSDVEQHLANLAAARAEADKWTQQLIVDELADLLPGLDAAEDQAAAALREACAALGKPQQRLAALDAEVERVTGQCAGWEAKLSAVRIEDRVEARVRFQAWNAELDRLKAEQEQAGQDLHPYLEARRKARENVELVQGARRGVAWAMAAPFVSPVAQGTRSYVGYRMPHLAHVILKGDQDDPEFEPAVTQLEELCGRLGWTIDRTSAEAQRIKRHWDEVYAAASPAETVPTGQEVMAELHAEMAVSAANKALGPSRIEDHRQPAPPRDYMDPHRVPDEYRAR